MPHGTCKPYLCAPLLHEQHIRPVGAGAKLPVCDLSISNVRTEPAKALARVKRVPIHTDATAIQFKLQRRAHIPASTPEPLHWAWR